MEKRINIYKKKLVISVILSYILGLMMFLGFICVVGIAGSLEFNNITIKQFILREIIAFAITGLAGFIWNKIEMRIENLSNKLHILYRKKAMMKKSYNV